MNGKFFSKHFKLEKVTEGIYAAISKPGGGSVANAGFVDLGDRTIVFDTFNTQQAAEDLKRMAQEATNREKITWVVNSHWHGDHIRGNQVFSDSTIISSQITFEKIKELHPARIHKQKSELDGLTRYIDSLQSQNPDGKLDPQISFLKEMETSLPGLELTLPQQTFKNELRFFGTKRTAFLFTLGGGHSYCDAFLYLPEDKVIFTGDLLSVENHPAFFEESEPKNWVNMLRKIECMDFETAIPGHGPIGKKSDIAKVMEYMEDIGELANREADNIEVPYKYQNWSSPEVFQKNIAVFVAKKMHP
ncbi:MBL fold metallo-hydrolase [Neobacillus sp. Marseille-QA0830]